MESFEVYKILTKGTKLEMIQNQSNLITRRSKRKQRNQGDESARGEDRSAEAECKSE